MIEPQPFGAVVRGAAIAVTAALIGAMSPAVRGDEAPTADGFRGIWYAVGPTGDEYAYKYSGGLGTYTHQTSPLAIYAAAVERTYFVYGGTIDQANTLGNFISYYDHKTGQLARPRLVRQVGGNDNHRNATLAIDDDGYLWVFGNSHGDSGGGHLYRSERPYEIAAFEELPLPTAPFANAARSPKIVLSYSNPFWSPGRGLAVVYSQYHDGRAVHLATSPDGRLWTDRSLFDTNDGHYTVARMLGPEKRLCITADYHAGKRLDQRTNLYYLESSDFGSTWKTAAGAPLSLPLTQRDNPALVRDYLALGKLVYMKDIDLDAEGRPVILYLTVDNGGQTGHLPGPREGGRMLHTAHWTGEAWEIRDAVPTDHNYDHGELEIAADGTWRLMGPFLEGPQPFGTGGEVGEWLSRDQGATWRLDRQLTRSSEFNHTYVRRPVDADEEFIAFWADGNARRPSDSRLYFTNVRGEVYRMPVQMDGEFARPELASPR